MQDDRYQYHFLEISRACLFEAQCGYDHLTQTQPQSRGVGIGYDHLNPTIDDNITDRNI